MVEVEGDDGVGAGVPDLGGDGEVEDDVALDGLVGVDAGLAEEGRGVLGGGEFPEGGEAGVEVFELGVLDGAGGGLEGAVGGNEGGGEVFEEEREAEAVGDAEGDDGIQIVLRRIFAYDDGVGLKDGVGGVDLDVGDGDVSGGAGGKTEEEEAGEAKEDEREENGDGEISALGLGEGKIGHGLRIAVRRRMPQSWAEGKTTAERVGARRSGGG